MDATKELLEATPMANTKAVYVRTAALVGFDGEMVQLECDTSNGLPSITIVGLGSKAIDESKERVRSAITNSRLNMPKKRITLNLAPADLPKEGSSYDLPLALAILLSSKQIPPNSLKSTLVTGELSLDGSLRSTRGSISYAQIAKQNGIKRLIIPKSGAEQASFVEGVDVIGVSNLRELYEYLNEQKSITPTLVRNMIYNRGRGVDLSDISGQIAAKRALEISVAGWHNILFNGPPGTGKTMLAKSCLSLLSPLNRGEVIEVTKLHSLASGGANLITARPFRQPHHSSSHVALVGGGRKATPGEISLAHKGVLFLDELPEYSRQSLESLRQPLEDKKVTIARAEQTVTYPADFLLVATQNPCPCGYYGDKKRSCNCTAAQISRYQTKLSGPLLDRIDLVCQVDRVEHEKLLDKSDASEASEQVSLRVKAAREIQIRRSGKPNGLLSSGEARFKTRLTDRSKELLVMASKRLELSSRSYIQLIKVARTIADLEGEEDILPTHISEALQYRHRRA